MTSSASLLLLSLAVLAVCALSLLALTVQARVSRRRRERAVARVQGRWRALLLEVASGEDEEGSACRTLAEVTPQEWPRLRPAVVSLLGKVRGRPAAELSRVLAAHGDLERARAALGSSRAGDRAAAAHLVGLARDAESLDGLRALLADPSPDVRVVAARSLGLIGDPSAAPDVLAAAGSRSAQGAGEPGLPAWVAAETLLLLGPGVQGAVAQAIAAPDAATRAVAAQVAWHGAFSGAVPLARTCLHFETEVGTREALLHLLGSMGEEEDFPVLTAYTHPLAPPRLRRAAVSALGELATEQSRHRLAELLDDDDRSLAIAAGDSLARSGAPGLELLSIAQRGRGRARRVAASALHIARLREDVVREVA